MVDNQRVEDFDVAANLGVVGVSGSAHARVDVLIDNAVFQVEVHASIVVAFARGVSRLCAVNGCNRAVAIVPKAAYQDA